MSEDAPVHPDPASRIEAWIQDRATEATPLPGAGQTHYSSPYQRQEALVAAEKVNIARAAGALGLTSGEWRDLRAKLGRSPSAQDIRKR